MPYIDKDSRLEINTMMRDAHNSGELNYQITQLLQVYLKHTGLKYSSINDVLGALEGAKMEFYRRVVVPYEEQKIKDNGDIYK